jgi:hypothetical protein
MATSHSQVTNKRPAHFIKHHDNTKLLTALVRIAAVQQAAGLPLGRGGWPRAGGSADASVPTSNFAVTEENAEGPLPSAAA